MHQALQFLRENVYGNQVSFSPQAMPLPEKIPIRDSGGNVGINLAVAPMAYLPSSGWRESFFKILQAQGRDAVEFWTKSEVVVERWSRQDPRQF